MEIHVTRPSLFLLAFACLMLLIGAFGFCYLQFARDPRRLTFTGLAACLTIGLIALSTALLA